MFGQSRKQPFATHIGSIASEWLAACSCAQVAGCISQGVFIRCATQQIVFLSPQSHRGPLTLNLQGSLVSLASLQPGNPVAIHAQAMRFPENGFNVWLDSATRWSAPPPDREAARGSFPRFAAALRSYYRQRPTGLLAALLEWLDSGDSRPPAAGGCPGLARLFEALQSPQPEAVAVSLEGFYGLGSGLTPSGDDLILGVLLALNRWGRQLYPGLDIPAINQSVIQTASRKTTALSASLIACACQGQADERLIFALDGLTAGSAAPAACAAALLTWGNSSGGNALAGMVVAIAHASSSAGSPYPDRVQ